MELSGLCRADSEAMHVVFATDTVMLPVDNPWEVVAAVDSET